MTCNGNWNYDVETGNCKTIFQLGRGHDRAPADFNVWFKAPGSYVLSIFTLMKTNWDHSTFQVLRVLPTFVYNHLLKKFVFLPPVKY